ncbi:MAG TPA: M15 family metallopeptidase [Bacteroidales bacterium]|nr:M15 family metallopeptidase [Bacteroidales bacterium]
MLISNRIYILIQLIYIFWLINPDDTISVYQSCDHQNIDVITSYEEYLRTVNKDPNMKLVPLNDSIQGLKLDIRYATENNFTKQKVYSSADPYLRIPAMRALRKVQDSLSKHNIGLIVFDAYRPYSATVKFYEIVKDTRFVADPKVGSKHNRGCAIDVSLYDLSTGKELAMPTPFDDFSAKANATYPELPGDVLQNRALLAGVMQAFGFLIYPDEWWHFDYQDWENYPLMDIPLEELRVKSEE